MTLSRLRGDDRVLRFVEGRGKSELRAELVEAQGTVLDNIQAEQSDGQCNRKYTA
jgi:hypothetical protein